MAARFRLPTIKIDLHPVLYVSDQVPADRFRSLVPSALTQAVARGRVFLSIAAMQCGNVHPSGLKWPSFRYGQLNLCTYVLVKAGTFTGHPPLCKRKKEASVPMEGF